jgi:hypothetical protein
MGKYCQRSNIINEIVETNKISVSLSLLWMRVMTTLIER